MVKWLMRRAIAAFERQWNYDASYVHEIIEASPRAAWVAEAEDAVQEAYLRWHDADRKNVAEPRAFLITTTTRICLEPATQNS